MIIPINSTNQTLNLSLDSENPPENDLTRRIITIRDFALTSLSILSTKLETLEATDLKVKRSYNFCPIVSFVTALSIIAWWVTIFKQDEYIYDESYSREIIWKILVLIPSSVLLGMCCFSWVPLTPQWKLVGERSVLSNEVNSTFNGLRINNISSQISITQFSKYKQCFELLNNSRHLQMLAKLLQEKKWTINREDFENWKKKLGSVIQRYPMNFKDNARLTLEEGSMDFYKIESGFAENFYLILTIMKSKEFKEILTQANIQMRILDKHEDSSENEFKDSKAPTIVIEEVTTPLLKN